MYLQNKYTIWYYSIINNAKNRIIDDYTESHHIIPKSFYIEKSSNGWISGNADDPENLVKLTAREHLICHRLLQKMTTGVAKSKMNSSAWLMATVFVKNKRVKITSRVYEYIRKEHAITHKITMTGRKRPRQSELMTGRVRPDQSEIMKGRYLGELNPRYGKPGTFAGKTHTQEALAKMRKPTGPHTKQRELLTCPHCQKTADSSNAKRWHFNNCKFKTLIITI